MPATGHVFRHRGPYLAYWSVEYDCAPCNQVFRISTPETDTLVAEIVRTTVSDR